MTAPNTTPTSKNAATNGRPRPLPRQGRGGDPEELRVVQDVLDDHPEFWKTAGDLGLQAEARLIELAAGPNLLDREAIRRNLQELKASLAGDSPIPLVRLLVERVALSWLQLSYLDRLVAREMNAQIAGEVRKRHDGAHRRFLHAVRVLESIQSKLKPPQRGEDQGRVVLIPEILLERFRGRRRTGKSQTEQRPAEPSAGKGVFTDEDEGFQQN